MPQIEILGTGRIDDRDSAFPQAVQLPDGDILCSYSVGGGAYVNGGTEFSRSTDGGETWTLEGTILPATEQPRTSNNLKLSISHDGKTLYAYGSRFYRDTRGKFGEGRNEPVFCRSLDYGRSWSQPKYIPMSVECPLEISHGILALPDNRLLAPAATLPAQDRLGEQVIVAVSDDGGETWPKHSVVFQDPEKKRGFFEQKLARISPARLMGVCWTVTLGDTVDQPNHFVLSRDNGATWSTPRSTDIMGQTMTPIPLSDSRLMVLYNQRYGEQAIRMCLVIFLEDRWNVIYEDSMYDTKSVHQRPENLKSGVEEFDAFTFGFPTAIKLPDGDFLATHWCKEEGKFGIRWTKLRVEW